MPTKTMKTLAVSASALLIAQVAFPVTLSELTDDYDVFVKGTAKLNSGHVHGALAAGNVDSTNTLFNSQGGAHDAPFSLATKTINLSGNSQVGTSDGQGQVRIETIVAGQSFDAPNSNQIWLKQGGASLDMSNAGNTPASVHQSTGIDFASNFSALESLSNEIAGYTADLGIGALTSGSDNSISAPLSVINTTWNSLFSAGSLFFNNLTSTAKVIINVDLSGGAGSVLNGNHNGANERADNILWNFYGANGLLLNLGSQQWYGSILAPNNGIKHSNTQALGMVIAENYEKSSQVHIHKFDYDFPDPDPAPPAVPDSGSTALLVMLGLPLLAWVRARIAKQ